ncbi:hypothetical protein BC828DRAFT_437628 [Blastocladiella britannica]|nr:hypothetical protein BC828DRAFT_437628 [Blastocladiella britannica]
MYSAHELRHFVNTQGRGPADHTRKALRRWKTLQREFVAIGADNTPLSDAEDDDPVVLQTPQLVPKMVDPAPVAIQLSQLMNPEEIMDYAASDSEFDSDMEMDLMEPVEHPLTNKQLDPAPAQATSLFHWLVAAAAGIMSIYGWFTFAPEPSHTSTNGAAVASEANPVFGSKSIHHEPTSAEMTVNEIDSQDDLCPPVSWAMVQQCYDSDDDFPMLPKDSSSNLLPNQTCPARVPAMFTRTCFGPLDDNIDPTGPVPIQIATPPPITLPQSAQGCAWSNITMPQYSGSDAPALQPPFLDSDFTKAAHPTTIVTVAVGIYLFLTLFGAVQVTRRVVALKKTRIPPTKTDASTESLSSITSSSYAISDNQMSAAAKRLHLGDSGMFGSGEFLDVVPVSSNATPFADAAVDGAKSSRSMAAEQPAPEPTSALHQQHQQDQKQQKDQKEQQESMAVESLPHPLWYFSPCESLLKPKRRDGGPVRARSLVFPPANPPPVTEPYELHVARRSQSMPKTLGANIRITPCPRRSVSYSVSLVDVMARTQVPLGVAGSRPKSSLAGPAANIATTTVSGTDDIRAAGLSSWEMRRK